MSAAVGAVVLSYGIGGEYAGVLESLRAEGIEDTSVVVVHNPSRSSEPPPAVPAGVDVVEAGYNRGYAGGMNLGIERQLARGVDLVLLLTHDARLRPGALAALIEAAGRAPRYGVLGPALVLAGSGEPFSYGGLTRANGSVTHLRELPDHTEDGIAACDWVDGGTMLLRAAALRRIGAFDERFWSYCEEAEFCLRATRAGYDVGVVPAAKAEQAPGGSRRVGAWAYLLTRNGIAYGRRAAGFRGGIFMTSRTLWIAATAALRAGARAARLRPGDSIVPWAEAVGALRGAVDATRGRWGPPPSLPGPGDVGNTAPPLSEPELRRRPRVLHMGPALETGGGMAAALGALLDSPLAEGYELEVVETYRRPEPARRLLVYSVALLRLLAWRLRRRGRIVHVHATVRGSMYRKSVLTLLARAIGLRVVLQIHSGPGDVAAFAARTGRAGLALFAAALRRADDVVAVSRATADAVRSGYGAAEVGVGVVPNAAPPVMPEPEPQRSTRSSKDMRALYLGGFANRAKGGDVLIEALGRPEGRGGARFVLAGPGEPPEEGRALIAADDRLEWRGWLEEGERLAALGEADAFVLSSRSEGLPMALLEAMASGLAIVATSVGGVPDVLADERDALLVPPEDPQALAAALSRLEADPDLRVRLGRAARERAGELDASEVAGRLSAIYAGLLG